MPGMKKLGIYSIYAALTASSIPAAMGQENEAVPASLSLQFTGLKWAQSSTKYSDEDITRKSTSLMTGDLVDAVVYATISKWNVYFYPFQDINALVSLSYMVRDDLEVGVDVGLNSSKLKEPKSEFSSDLLGAFVTWGVGFEGFSLENFAVLDYTRVESTTLNTTTNMDETSKVTGSFVKISSTAVVPIAKNAHYLAGIWAAAERGTNHALDTTKKSSQFGLMLAGLRLTLD